MFYDIAKALHVISVISWMAGMLYLPRLFAYHADAAVGSEISEQFKIMERRLYKIIINPAMVSAWIFGLYLTFISEAYVEGWFHVKIFAVLLMSAVHGAMKGWLAMFAEDRNTRSPKFFRVMNEVPTVLMIVAVVMVIVKPF